MARAHGRTSSYEMSDIAALSFATPSDEAQHIAATAQALRGVAFLENGEKRGLSWSDMAVLLRSVKANAEPIMEALQAAGVPFVVTGMIALGPVGYFKHMVPEGTPLAIAPVVILLEIISMLVRPIALMIRLGANMTAGHIVILIILGFIFLFQSVAVSAVSVPLAAAIMLLEIIVAFIQAYVFTLLTALYVGMLVAEEH